MKDFDFIPIGSIASINDRDDLILVNDSYEIDQIWEYLGIDPEPLGLYGLFVKIENGDYSEIYAYSGSLSNLSKMLYKYVEVKQN
jgi:hypothetical protein